MATHSLLVGALLLGAETAAHAQAPPEPATPDHQQVEVITVTAQRRVQRLQDVPIAITALSADQLSSIGASDIADLNQVVPGLVIQSATGFVIPRIRGVGTTSLGPGLENSVGVYVDGVYLATQTGSLLSLNNVERIEVLKGPQGTLFGRNATGGLIQIVTRRPTQDFVANASIGYDNYETITGDAYISSGLSPNLAADLALHLSSQGQGYGINRFSGRDVNRTDTDVAVRSRWVFTPTSSTTIDLTGDYMRRTGNASASVHQVPGTFAFLSGMSYTGSPWDVNSDVEPRQFLDAWGTSLRIDQNLGGPTLTSITAYRRARSGLIFDPDLTTTPGSKLDLVQEDEQFSQELQLSSARGSPLQWVVGLYYFNATGGFDPAIVTVPLPFPPFSAALVTRDEEGTESLAAYAQGTLEIAPRTAITVGARYTSEKRTLNGVASGPPPFFLPTNFSYSRRFEAPTWRIALEHRLAGGTLLYASYNRGFKSGGYNAANPFSPNVLFRPEFLDAYELGFKSELFGRRVRFNGAFFYYDYRNIQVSKFVSPTVIYVNGAGAEVYGADFEIEARVTRNLTVSAGLSLLHDRFTSFPDADFYLPQTTFPFGNVVVTGSAAGNRLPVTPDMTFNLNLHYEQPTSSGTWLADAGYYHNSGWFGQPDNILRQRAYDRIDAAIGWRSSNERFAIRLWAKNLTDRAVASALAANSTGSQIQVEPPRTFGATFSTRF
jgi:outer membrane receptor protein involved in Fe transport